MSGFSLEWPDTIPKFFIKTIGSPIQGSESLLIIKLTRYLLSANDSNPIISSDLIRFSTSTHIEPIIPVRK